MIDRSKAAEIHQDVRKAIQEIEKRHGVKLVKSNGTYTPSGNNLTLKLDFIPAAMEARNFERESILLGFKRNIAGMSFKSGRSTYVITEVRLRNSKYPIIAENQNGASYKFTVNQIKNQLLGAI